MIYKVHEVLNFTIVHLIIAFTSFRFHHGIFLLSGSDFEQDAASGLEKNLNFSLSFGRADLAFRLPGATPWSSQLMILSEDDLSRPLPIEYVSLKSYLPSKKIYLSRNELGYGYELPVTSSLRSTGRFELTV